MVMRTLQVLPLVVAVVWTIEYLATITRASTHCVDGDVRLIGGSHDREGKVEVCRNQQWGRVCDDSWDENDSAVVCKQLGFSEEGAQAFLGNMGSFFVTSPRLPYVLDDLGCNGTESNLLECLPQHNCASSSDETAGVRCLRKGVTLEYGTSRLNNNTLISVTDIKENNAPLLCATDRTACCTNSDHSGNWYIPNGYKITQQITNSSQAFYISRGNQTVELNYINGSDVPTGIYHCKIPDDNNISNYLYVGIYSQNKGNISITSLHYNSTTCTIVCTSTGGPATTVFWSKDGSSVLNDGQYYELTTIIIDRISATYENKLMIFNKSSKATGTYTCTVGNAMGSIQSRFHLEVCRDLELRFNHHSRNVEVCANDQWRAVVNSAIVNNTTLGNISSKTDSTSVTITWSPPNDLNVSMHDVTCTTIIGEQIHSVKVTNVVMSITVIDGLITDKQYECCITAYILRALPINTSSSSCITAKTLLPQYLDSSNMCSSSYIIGLGTTLSICLLLLGICVGCICLFLIKKQRNVVKELRVSIDKDNTEHMVVNPIYSDSVNESSEFQNRHLNIAENPQYGTRTEVSYEMINDLPTQPRISRRSDTSVQVKAEAASEIKELDEPDEFKQLYTSNMGSEIPKGKGEQGDCSNGQRFQQKPILNIYDLPLDP